MSCPNEPPPITRTLKSNTFRRDSTFQTTRRITGMLKAAVEKIRFHMDDAAHEALKDLALAILNSSNLLWLMTIMPRTEDETPLVLILRGEGSQDDLTSDIERAYQEAKYQLCSFERACTRDYQLIIAPINEVDSIATWLAHVQIARQRAVATSAM